MTPTVLIMYFTVILLGIYSGITNIRNSRKIKKLEDMLIKTRGSTFDELAAPQWKINGIKVRNLKHFQELIHCDDEILTTLKLKYGEIE